MVRRTSPILSQARDGAKLAMLHPAWNVYVDAALVVAVLRDLVRCQSLFSRVPSARVASEA
jgi:hypothetical protein